MNLPTASFNVHCRFFRRPDHSAGRPRREQCLLGSGIFHQSSELLHKKQHYNFWVLPGDPEDTQYWKNCGDRQSKRSYAAANELGPTPSIKVVSSVPIPPPESADSGWCSSMCNHSSSTLYRISCVWSQDNATISLQRAFFHLRNHIFRPGHTLSDR